MSTLQAQPEPLKIETPPIGVESRNQELLAHRDSALLLAYRISGNWADAEDILQDAYVHAVRAKTPLLSGAGLRKWFLQITANAAANFRRSDNRRRSRERNVAMQHDDRGTSPDARAEQLDLQRAVQAEFARLDEKFRAPIALHFEHGYSYDEAAEILNVPAGSLRSYASQGLKLLRERLDKPARPVSAEVLAAFLAAGIAAKASPALAAAVEGIVATGGALKSAAPAGMKVFAAGPKTGMGIAMKIAIACAACVLAAVAYVTATWALGQKNGAQNPGTAAETPAELKPLTRPEIPAPIMGNEAPPQIPPGLNSNPAINPVAAPPRKIISYQPPPEVEAQWKEAVELLPHIDCARNAVIGKWKSDGRTLQADNSGIPWSRLAIPYYPPEEYDYRIDFTRMAGNPDLMQIFSVKNSNFVFQLGSAGGTRYNFGLNKKDSPNPNAVAGEPLRFGARNTAIIEVRRDKITAYLNGKVIQSIAPRMELADSGPDWRLPDQSMLGIGTWFSGYAIHRIAVREVSGKGELVPDDPVAPLIASEQYWNDARSLMPADVGAGNIHGGKWTINDGHVGVVAEQASRLQLNFKPPQEYDMRLVFTRTAGEVNVSHILVAGGHPFSWKIGAWDVVTLDYAGKVFLDSPSAMHVPGHLENNVVHKSVVCVRKDRIRAYIDGKLYLNLATNYSELQIEDGWRLKSAESLGIGVNSATVLFYKIQIKEVTGVGEPLLIEKKEPPTDAF